LSEKQIIAVCSTIIIALCTLAAVAIVIVPFPENWSREAVRFGAFAAILPFVFGVAYYARKKLATFPPRPVQKRVAPNALVYVGFALQYFGVGLFKPGINLGLACIVVGFVLLPWGSVKYAKAKGYPAWLGGVLGMMTIFGFLVLAVLPDRVEKDKGA